MLPKGTIIIDKRFDLPWLLDDEHPTMTGIIRIPDRVCPGTTWGFTLEDARRQPNCVARYASEIVPHPWYTVACPECGEDFQPDVVQHYLCEKCL